MALEIVWTTRAQTGFARIIEYLETHFSEKEVRQFVRQSNDFFELLRSGLSLAARNLDHNAESFQLS
ncbi:hypothetical protein GCM10027284_17080 [Cyclobacterium sediminis]